MEMIWKENNVVDAKIESIVDDLLNIYHMSKKSNDITIESREKIYFIEWNSSLQRHGKT